MPRHADPDPPLPVIVSMRQALAAGLSPDQVRHRVRSGRWESIARGIYRTRPVAPDQPPWQVRRDEHAARAVAEVAAHPGTRLGFDSAVVVRDLPLWTPLSEDVSLIAGPGGRNGARDGVVVHRMELDVRDVCYDPVPMTSVPRTWFDIARTRGLTDAVVLGDAACRAGLMTQADVRRLCDTALARRGIRGVREAARQLDPRRETALESASWVYFLRHRLPLPRVQVEIRARDGRLIARVDFLWDGARLVGEADGQLKYVAAADLYAEKRREDELRAEGLGVVRWGATDLRTEDLAARLRRILG